MIRMNLGLFFCNLLQIRIELRKYVKTQKKQDEKYRSKTAITLVLVVQPYILLY